MTRARGEFESEIMEMLWRSPGGLTGNEIRNKFTEPMPAITTVATVLERLREKGEVSREKKEGRGYRYSPTQRQHEKIVNGMVKTLTESQDRELVLLHLAGNLTDSDREVLRKALKTRD
jgi:predicted transcriptional regulator